MSSDSKKQNRVFNLHFIGIGGIGMSGIAEIFLSRGHVVSGSDLSANEVTERLVRMGAVITVGHAEENIKNADVVVISSAVKPTNPEVLEAKKQGIPVIARAEMLAEIMRGKTGIGIAGTHGKTTTTSMVAQILIAADLDPTVVVGGKVEAIGSNAKAGGGDAVVVEADESDGSFQLLPCTYTLITNIDLDHMEYYHTRKNLNDAFIQFARNIPFYGCTWLCGDDAGVKEVLPFLSKPHLTYGFEAQNDVIAKNVEVHPRGHQTFEIWARLKKNETHEKLGDVELAVLGKHNVLNALGAASLAMGLGVSFSAIQTALLHFKHVRRRFDQCYYSAARGIRVVDDYGHHPTEVQAVLLTARQTAHSRVVTFFQPHRFTRTELCWNEFMNCFQETDLLILLPIYSAGEEPIEGVTSEALGLALKEKFSAARSPIQVIQMPSIAEAEQWALANVKDDDLVLTLGAGSITKLAHSLAHSFARVFNENR